MTDHMKDVAFAAFTDEIQKIGVLKNAQLASPEMKYLFDYFSGHPNPITEVGSTLRRVFGAIKKTPSAKPVEIIKKSALADTAERILRTGIVSGKTAIPSGTAAGFGVKKMVDLIGGIYSRPNQSESRLLKELEKDYLTSGGTSGTRCKAIAGLIKNVKSGMELESQIKNSRVQNFSTGAGIAAGTLAGAAHAIQKARNVYPMMRSTSQIRKAQRNLMIGAGAGLGGGMGLYGLRKHMREKTSSAKVYDFVFKKLSQYEVEPTQGVNPILKAGLGGTAGYFAGKYGGPHAGGAIGNLVGRQSAGVLGKIPIAGKLVKNIYGGIGHSKGMAAGGKYGPLVGLGLGALGSLMV